MNTRPASAFGLAMLAVAFSFSTSFACSETSHTARAGPLRVGNRQACREVLSERLGRVDTHLCEGKVTASRSL
jgi:hypothetical protein